MEAVNSGADITGLLVRWRDGDSEAEALLIAAIYPVLRAMSAKRLASGSPVTLSPTELVHESYIRLVAQRDLHFANRSHFFALSAHIIRRILVDHWRARVAQKRAGDIEHITLSVLGDLVAPGAGEIALLDIDRLLDRLERIDGRAARLVELRFFAGMSIEQAASVTGRSISTAKRDWKFARAWLHEQLHLGEDGACSTY